MRDFSTNRPYSAPRSGNGGRKFGSDFSKRHSSYKDGGRADMHDAVCAECGKTCQVPFLPNGSKPVYCSDCFEERGNGEDRSSRPSFSRPSFGDRPSFQEKRPYTPAVNPESDNKKFDIIIAKLDKIMKLLVAAQKLEKPRSVTQEIVDEVVAATEEVAEVSAE